MKRFGLGNYYDPNNPEDPTRLEALWQYLLIVTDHYPEIVRDLYDTFYPVFDSLNYKWVPVPPHVFDENPALSNALQEWRHRSPQLAGIDDSHLQHLVGHIVALWKVGKGRFRNLRDLDPVFVYSSEGERETFRFLLVKAEASYAKDENGDVVLGMMSKPDFLAKDAKFAVDYNPLAETRKDARRRILAIFKGELKEHFKAIEAQTEQKGLEKNRLKETVKVCWGKVEHVHLPPLHKHQEP